MPGAVATLPTGAIAVARGCGTRKVGGIYWTLGVGPGQPWHRFLIDPPVPVPTGLRCPNQGVALFEDPRHPGRWHLIDRVGAAYYPNVADFVEEFRRFGVSRRLPRSLDFSKLSPQSCLYVAHARAYNEQWRTCGGRCPTGKGDAEGYHDCICCCGFWWNDLRTEGVVPITGGHWREVRRHLPGFTYAGKVNSYAINGGSRAEFEAEYRLALFARFPIGELQVVRDGQTEHHHPSLFSAVRANGVTVRVTDH